MYHNVLHKWYEVISYCCGLQTECGLELMVEAGSNLVLRVFNVPPTPIISSNYTDYVPTPEQDRDRCLRPMNRVAYMFVHREPRIKHDVRLSLFKLAEVVDNVPSPQRISSSEGLRPHWWVWVVGVALALASTPHQGLGS